MFNTVPFTSRFHSILKHMLIVISPAKNLNFKTPLPTTGNSQPALLDRAELLMGVLRELAPQQLSRLMGISDKLSVLNYDRNQAWATPFTVNNARPAVLAFNGDVYTGLNAYQFSESDFDYAQHHLRILSGLYGILRPLDLIQAYRLEMGTRFATSSGADLYQFWGDRITELLNQHLHQLNSRVVVNLASIEYFKAVKQQRLTATVVTPVFKDWQNNDYKIVSFFAKKARGMMSAYIIKNRIDEVNDLFEFNQDGYRYNPSLSGDTELVFTRR